MCLLEGELEDLVAFGCGFQLLLLLLPCRRHVNRVCLSAGIPLVESGTAGYIGQSYVIQKGVTRCFDCVPVADQKTYPICTIRRQVENL